MCVRQSYVSLDLRLQFLLIRPISLVCGRSLRQDLRLHARSTHLRWVSVPRGCTHDKFYATCGGATQREVRHLLLLHKCGLTERFSRCIVREIESVLEKAPYVGTYCVSFRLCWTPTLKWVVDAAHFIGERDSDTLSGFWQHALSLGKSAQSYANSLIHNAARSNGCRGCEAGQPCVRHHT